MKRKAGKEKLDDNLDRWMVSYADFVTLLFCFFTAMFAISNVDSNKLGKFVDSMRLAFNDSGSRGNGISVIEGVQVFVPADVEVESSFRETLASIIHQVKGDIQIKRDSRGVTITIADKLFFESGAAEMKGSAKDILDAVASPLERLPNMIRIEGHTDNVPINNSEFPSNWELSSARAIHVAKYFMNTHKIDPGRISTTGYAAFRPVASNDSPEGRAKNRRVDIVVLNEVESNKDPRSAL